MLEIRPARAEDRAAICAFLDRSFKTSIPMESWRGLVDCRWCPGLDRYGVVLLDAGELVGFLGVVVAERALGGQAARTGNLTSWYIQRPYRRRGLGLRMLLEAMDDAETTYTTFSSVPRALRLMEKAGLVPLDHQRLVWRSRGATAPPGLEAVRDQARFPDLLDSNELRVVSDHAGLGPEAIVVITGEGGTCLLVISVKRKQDDSVTYEVLHMSDRAVFARHARAIADAVLPASGAVLSVDRRFVGLDVAADRVEEIPVPRYFTAGRLAPHQVDFLYSETVLLDLKLY